MTVPADPVAPAPTAPAAAAPAQPGAPSPVQDPPRGEAPAPGSGGPSSPASAVSTPVSVHPVVAPDLVSFLEAKLASGDPVTIETRKESFTGQVCRLMLQEGWIALEHEDGRRRAFFVTEGGTLSDGTSRMPLGGSAPAGH